MKLLERIKAILLRPALAWRLIARESVTPTDLLLSYVACLAAIPAIINFLGMTLVGYTLLNGAVARVDILSAIMIAIFDYAVSFAIVAVLALIVNLSAPLFGASRDATSAFKLVVYSYTPVWLAGIFLLVPGLHFLIMLGFYGLFLLFKGFPVLMRMPVEKAFVFAGAISICAAIIVLIAGALRASLFSLPGIL
ncbi:MAG: Yip1 family protein [Xanthobacteraceae bacterium]